MRRTSLNRLMTAAFVLVFALSLVAVPALAQQPTATPTPGGQQQNNQQQGNQQQENQQGQAGQAGNQQQNPYDRIEIEVNSEGVEGPDALPLGTVILWVTNSDTVPHNVRIQGPGVERQFLSPIQPGATKTLRVEIMQGTYTIATLENNGESGMTLDLPVTVQEGGSTTEAQQGNQNQGGQQEQQATPTPSSGDSGQGNQQQGGQDQGQQATPTQGGQDSSGGQQGGQGDQSQQGNQQLVQQGEQIFSNNCARCHGQNGQGQVGASSCPAV